MPSDVVKRESLSAGDTERLGSELAATLVPGDVILLEGELGTGKTTFVRGACRALGVELPVTSPTFTIGQRYLARDGSEVAHVDLFRVADLEHEDPGLLADYVRRDTIAFVEWAAGAERQLARLGHVAMRVHLSHAGGDRRLVEVERLPEEASNADHRPGVTELQQRT
jgi:tRNA threonylcarbamoyladenosine biosynthesis protein TsaE